MKNKTKFFLKIFITSIICFMCLYYFVFNKYDMREYKHFPVYMSHNVGDSMSPTLSKDNYSISFRSPEFKNGDIIIAKMPERWKTDVSQKDVKWINKRLLGSPGDKIKINHEGLWINDELKVDFELPKDAVLITGDKEFTLTGYFVVGDNHKKSYDSLYRYFFYPYDFQLSKEDIYGSVVHYVYKDNAKENSTK